MKLTVNREPTAFTTIHVGHLESRKTYTVHKNVICHYSLFFSAASNGQFIEGETQAMVLEDADLYVLPVLSLW